MIFSKKMCFREFFGKFFCELLSALEKTSHASHSLFCLSNVPNLFGCDIFNPFCRLCLGCKWSFWFCLKLFPGFFSG
jgi:hypothetical protein